MSEKLPNIDTSSPAPVRTKESIEERFTNSTGLNVDLASLTIFGWLLGVAAIAVAALAIGFGFYLVGAALADDGLRVRRPGGVFLIVGIPAAILIAGVVFALGKAILSTIGISVYKKVTSESSVTPHARCSRTVPRCPNCGSKRGWDGTSCQYCPE